MIKKLGLTIIAFVGIYLLYHYESVIYGLRQAKGQVKIIWNSENLNTYLESNDVPDSILYKIELIKKVNHFSINQLGLEESKSYRSIYDQKGKAILWMLTASPEFEVKAHEWKFPIAGSFPYKGFFNRELAAEEGNKLKAKAYDIEIREVSAWSTLGFLSDPILTSMLEKEEGSLAELIIHELCHTSIYLKNQVQLNENLANFIGKEGAMEFLESEFGEHSRQLVDYKSSIERKKVFQRVLNEEIPKIKAQYEQTSKLNSLKRKRAVKDSMLADLKNKLFSSLSRLDSSRDFTYLRKLEINNAYLSSFGTYSFRQDSLKGILESKYHGNLKDFIQEFREE